MNGVECLGLRPRRGVLLVGIVFGLAAGWMLVDPVRGYIGRRTAVPRPIAPRSDLLPGERATIRLFEQASRSVVFITTVTQARDFFSLNIFEIPQGTGSGFIWDEHGHIVTNFHVVANATGAKVKLADGSTWQARFVGGAPDKDLAVLKIQAPRSRLRPIPIGTSRDLQVGQQVFAIGNPFGLDQTLTTGVVSALGRQIKSISRRTIEGAIQTDAAINPGNSGGPLLDSAGRLIGVNTMIYSPSGASAGIGFAVPVDTINDVVPQLIEHGRIIRPILGIEVLPDRVVRDMGVSGVMVASVLAGSGAAEAGLRGVRQARDGSPLPGDLIVKVDGKTIDSFDDLLEVLEKHEPGDVVTVTYVRDDEVRTAKVRLQAPGD